MDTTILHEIHNYCSNQQLCEKCPFYDNETLDIAESCPFCSHPFHWNLERIEGVLKNGLK